MHQEKVIEKTE